MRTGAQLTVRVTAVLVAMALAFSAVYLEIRGKAHARELLESHSAAIAADVWNFDQKAPLEYLNLAARHSGYERITVAIRELDAPFLTIEGPPLGAFDRLLFSLGLIRRYELSTPITTKGKTLGVLHIVRRQRYLYPCISYALAGLCVLLGLRLFLVITRANERLEASVSARTKELRDSERKLRAIFDHHFQLTGLLDVQGRLVAANQTALRFAGAEEADVLGQFFWDGPWWEPWQRHQVQDAVDSALVGEFVRFETTRPAATGEMRHIDFSLNPVRDADGNVTYLVHEGRDITDVKQVEEDLRSSQAQLSNALRIARAGHWEYDVATDTFTFNDNFYQIFRTTVEAVGGYTMSSADYAQKFCHPDDMHMVAEELQAACETDDPSYSRQLEHRILYTNGETGDIAVRFFIVKDSEARTVSVYGVNQDITERKRTEEAIRNSEKKFRALFEQAGDYILLLAPAAGGSFVVSDANEAACKVHGYTRDGLLGMHLGQLDAGLDKEQRRAKIETVLAGETLVVETSHVRKDGTVFPVEASVSLLDVGEGPPLH